MAIVGAGWVCYFFSFWVGMECMYKKREEEMGWDDETMIPQLWLAAAGLNELQWGWLPLVNYL
jgi:hypothetical protein